MWAYVAGATIIAVMSFYTVIDYNDQKKEMKEWLQENQQAVDFGRYAKEHMPKTYQIWLNSEDGRRSADSEAVLKQQRLKRLEEELR